ncbi:hypothetical protein PHISP_03861 [Aspergillus sp. HF37]|nr:hypothetical protein PHISP_03861 [Aspergillus sp. HF37]
MPRQDPETVKQLVASLDAASKKGKQKGKRTFSCKKSTFEVAGSNNIAVDSWKFLDWDYKRGDLPTYARGLFTTTLKNGTPEISVRGYDKFFNVDEVNSTKWRNVEMNTHGPYELSVKENGCIIFISGLEDDTLLVCSKHSTGAREDTNMSHAQAGEKWIERHTTSVGKTVKDLARELRRMNATAVGELCDDSFEEHVLAYDAASSGIYLHGINFNLPEFATLPAFEVHAFADQWGFKKANFVTFDDLKSVQGFLGKCAETGTWDGRETEGFVIRCQMSEGGTGPYRDWFFKYKFDEPYLMYRQWRECTKAVIAKKFPKIKKHHKITEEYLQYARRQLANDPKLGALYNQNHGIIAMREGFLKERGLKGSELIAMEAESHGKEVTKNVVLVTVASLGCGKTTVAVALTKLFGWGHVQNDNIPKQKNKPKKFAFDITSQLASHPVVIADRNNHQMRERKQIMDDVRPVLPDAQFVALQYVHEPKDQLIPGIREVTRRRVLDRGDNHQTIRAGTKSSEDIVGIMDGFLNRFEGVDTNRSPDEDFDKVIDLDIAAESRENLETVVKALHSSYPRLVERMPTPQELDDALNSAMRDYHVQLDLSHGYESKQGQKKPNNNNNNNSQQQKGKPATPEALSKQIEYFNISVPSQEITSTLQTLFPSGTPPEKARTYNHLVNTRRIQPNFHVTLIHRAMKKDRPQIWDLLAAKYIQTMKEKPESEANITPPLAPARIRLERLIWDSRIMAFVVRILPPGNDDQVRDPWPCANDVPHVTVGTVAPDVKPKESNDLLKRWLAAGSGGNTGISEAEIPGVKVVKGSVGVVMSRR